MFFYLAIYLVMNMAAFAVVVARERVSPAGDDISSFEGLGRADPWLAWPLTIAMFGLFASGLWAEAEERLRRLGTGTAAAGTLWIACNVLMSAQYLIDDLAGAKGIFHRAAQVVFGLWLIALALAAGRDAVPRAWQDRQ